MFVNKQEVLNETRIWFLTRCPLTPWLAEQQYIPPVFKTSIRAELNPQDKIDTCYLDVRH
jgi:hypothetical protein